MDKITLITIILWIPALLDQSLNWVYWLQVKEYRFDRFKSFIKSPDGKDKLDTRFISIKWLSIILTILFPSLLIFLMVLFLLMDLRIINKIYKKHLRKPVLTLRTKRILLTSVLLFIPSLIHMFLVNLPKGLLLGEISILTGPLIGILWTLPLVNKAKSEELTKAKKKLTKINPLVIAITGSYGKTTTKDFLAHLLSKKI